MADEKETMLSMDETDKPELVDAPTIDHSLAEAKAEIEALPPEGAAEPKAERERGPDGKFVSKEKGDSEEAPASGAATPADNPIPDDQFKGYLTEKRKRQELEDRDRANAARIAELEAQLRKPQAPTPEFWDDPQGFMAKQLEQHTEQVIQRFQQQQTMERINASETVAKGKYADYDDAFRAFQQAASANPSLIQRMTAASDPAEFAYKTGKTAIDLEKVGSMDELLAQKRAEWEAELRAKAPQLRQTFPTSTVSDGSVASRGGPVWAGPTQDRDILPMG